MGEYSLTELHWAAGFWDGEGCATLNSRPGGNAKHACVVVNVSQVEREPLDRLQAALGVGKVYGPYTKRGRPNHAPIYQYTCTKMAEVVIVENLLTPFLCKPKRDQWWTVRRRVLELREAPATRQAQATGGPSTHGCGTP